MHCPSCKQNLVKNKVVGISVYFCSGGCGGLWFGKDQLKKLPERLPASGVSLLELDRAEGIKTFRNVEHICPYCETTLLYRHFFSKQWEFEVDQCSKCGGIWIDVGRLPNILQSGAPEEQKVQQVKLYIKTFFDEKLLMMDIGKFDVLEAALAIQTIFLFLCPYGHIPKDKLLSI